MPDAFLEKRKTLLDAGYTQAKSVSTIAALEVTHNNVLMVSDRPEGFVYKNTSTHLVAIGFSKAITVEQYTLGTTPPNANDLNYEAKLLLVEVTIEESPYGNFKVLGFKAH